MRREVVVVVVFALGFFWNGDEEIRNFHLGSSVSLGHQASQHPFTLSKLVTRNAADNHVQPRVLNTQTATRERK